MDEIATLGQAVAAGWRLTARCDRRRTALKSARPCPLGSARLDLATMLWTHGRDYPLSRLQGRVRCPGCGTLHVLLLWRWPPASGSGAP
jgi:hypothetical protein